jgi:exoribonuclease-2
MDDALYAESTADGKLLLTVAIADPTAWIAEGSKLDNAAKVRAFTNYLPGFNIPMLPRELSDDLCSLRANEVRPVLACRMTLAADGTIEDNIEFFAATIESKAKLAYDDVSDWLEGRGSWQPDSEAIAQQITLLKDVCQRRSEWRQTHALVFKDRPDYRFVLGEKGEVLDIVAEPRRIANRIVEESMIAANICAARVLRDKLGFGVYNVHTGFDPANTEQLAALLKTHDVHVDPTEVLTLEGFCKLRRELDAQPTGFLDSRIRRFQSFAEISTEPGPHFGLGLEAYATWTSPIRKYGDMINHRLLKAIIKGETIARPRMKPPCRWRSAVVSTGWPSATSPTGCTPVSSTIKPGPIPASRRRSSTSAAAGCACVWWTMARSPLFRPRSSTPCATNWCAARRTVPCRSKVK